MKFRFVYGGGSDLLEERVNAALAEGWKLQGPAIVRKDCGLYQAMVKPGPVEYAVVLAPAVARQSFVALVQALVDVNFEPMGPASLSSGIGLCQTLTREKPSV